MSQSNPVVLITNDDGPPNDHDSSFVLPFVQSLQERLGWRDMRVVLPSSQKSWIGKAYQIKDTINMSHYHPPQGQGTTDKPWVLLDGTPATCSNIALHNLYPGEIKLVVSGPNYGRNTSSAFALSSGTVGAAMSASMAGIPAIALSYGIFDKPIPAGVVEKANEIACTVIKKLWTSVLNNNTEPHADVYNVNIPLTVEILGQDSSAPLVHWTTMAPTKYGRLFVPLEQAKPETSAEADAEEAGPAAVPIHSPPPHETPQPTIKATSTSFKFKPDIGSLVRPDAATLVPGTDIWAIHHNFVSITPLKSCFEAAAVHSGIETEDGSGKGLWKL
ncbi:sure-like protein [Cystobasidium minutum MCA 4210]|uniref:sure-like protein n=1 Tax=Cystobasidium minutum MCA 4210 TaxID=1397322 RepID=UPI0034CDD6E2|eukprot:jgi/Rhomi1/170640/fgenesh1_kg.4_\